MTTEFSILLYTAISIGFVHTLLGPDHYIPFIALAKSRKWSLRKTSLVTLLCGIGHILGSVILGIIGVSLGIIINKLEIIESHRGEIAGWLLISFGLLYFVWGMERAVRNKPHSHMHLHHDGRSHEHTHNHLAEHSHIHEEKSSITPWVLFIIFVLGPCEPLIPILMYPAAQNSISSLMLVTAAFGFATIFTMLLVVFAGLLGINLLPIKKAERFAHASAGFAILICGISIKFLGL